ncbi:uncharacterized protein PHACADRAFT_107213, partial [Phanerochaete carnosa HHB-10118-sp]
RRKREQNQAQAAAAKESGKNTLTNHLTTAPTYTFITLKPVTIDISKHTAVDFAHIFTPKFAATLKRFNVLETLNCPDILTDDISAVFKLCNCLTHLDHTLKNVSCVISIEEWNCWDSGLKEISRILFKGLQHNRVRVFKALHAVWNNGYFN